MIALMGEVEFTRPDVTYLPRLFLFAVCSFLLVCLKAVPEFHPCFCCPVS